MCAVKRRTLIVSHADADGYLIAEQMRRNLELIPSFEVKTLVDPDRTKDSRVWRRLETLHEVDNADLVFFVDLMFSPDSFVEEAKKLVIFVKSRPKKQFFLIDHHPLPLRRLESAQNLRVRPETL